VSNVSIFVSSCDDYQACWKPFCHGLKKYWPDCPWPIFVVTNYLDPPCGWKLKVGKDSGWVTMQRKALKQISSEVILFMLDDFWLTDRVNTQGLIDFSNLIIQGKADKIHLTNFPDERKTVAPSKIDKRLNGYTKTSRYRTCLQGGLWRVSTFLNLMRDGESPWEFETKGSKRSENTSYVFLNVKEHRYLPYIIRPGAVEKGEWTKGAREYAVKEGLKINFSRGVYG